MRFHSTVEEMLKDVVYVVEASSFEQLCLWQQWYQAGSAKWVDDNSGYIPTVGYIEGRPICISISRATVNGKDIAFFHATSQAVDWIQIGTWLKKNCPKSIEGNGYFNYVDAGNFHCAV